MAELYKNKLSESEKTTESDDADNGSWESRTYIFHRKGSYSYITLLGLNKRGPMDYVASSR